MKNLVMIHLESLSQQIYHYLRDEFFSLDVLLERSTKFESFFSTATSSIMAVCDVLHGNNFELDESISFDEMVRPGRVQRNLFRVLREIGFRTRGVGYPRIWRDDINSLGIWDSDGEPYLWFDRHDDFMQEITNFLDKNADKPFALYVWDLRSHLAYADPVKTLGKNAIERIKLGYSCLNDTVSRILRLIEGKGILGKTIILGFGDHGDELWTHSLNGGFCHANEPYTNLIWTPAFVYDQNQTPQTRAGLASLIDLKNTCLGLLGVEDPDAFEYSGINLFQNQNTVVYSQNLFANQKPDKPLIKSYSVTNHDYHLIVSENGIEMHAYRLDPTNHCNLLGFFEMEREGEISFRNRGGMHPHFQNFFTEDQINHIKSNYYFLFKALAKRVLLKNKMIKGSESFPFDMTNFLRIREST